MYARYECRHLIGTGTEAKLLVEPLMSRDVLLQNSPDSLDGVWRSAAVCLKRPLCTSAAKAAVCSSVRRERSVCSINCYDTVWTGHLELEISVVWHHVESSKCGSSKQCVIATAKGDDIED